MLLLQQHRIFKQAGRSTPTPLTVLTEDKTLRKIPSWRSEFPDVLNVILGHKYYQNHSDRFMLYEWSQLQQKVSFIIIVCMLLWRLAKVTMCTLPQCRCPQGVRVVLSMHILKDTNSTKRICCRKFWLHSLNMNLLEWIWWYLWPSIVFYRNFHRLLGYYQHWKSYHNLVDVILFSVKEGRPVITRSALCRSLREPLWPSGKALGW